MRRLVPLLTMVVVAWSAMIGAAEARDPTPVPGAYPETGPTTTTTTIPIPTDYPETAPTTTTTVPPTTTVAPTPVPTTTVAPTPAPPRTPAPEPEPELEDNTTDPDAVDGEDTDITMYELAEEHASIIIQAGQPGVAEFSALSAPPGAEIGRTGTIRYTPDERAGGSTVVIRLAGERADGSTITVTVRVLVTETNAAPEFADVPLLRGFPGKITTATFSAIDTDLPADDLSWRVNGPAGMSIDDGVITWSIPDDAEPGVEAVTVIVRDDGEPAATSRMTVEAEIIDTSEAAVAAVDADGQPVNPMVIAATDDGAAPILVDLDDPGALMTAVAERTPKGAARPTPAAVTIPRGPIESSAIVESVEQTLAVLLELDVPTTAVAGGLVWQFALLSAPSVLGRRRGLYDIVGVAPDELVGDETFRFRANATGLPGSKLRRRDGRWMRAIASPRGPVWIPRANLRPSEVGR